MPKEREFLDPVLERTINLRKHEYSTNLDIHIPYNDLPVKTERKLNSFRFGEDDSEMTELQKNKMLNDTIEELSVTPFTLLVTSDFSLIGNCKSFDDFISRLRYCQLYIDYRKNLDLNNPKVLKEKKFLFMTKKSEKREKPTKKVYIRYQNQDEIAKKKAYSDGTIDSYPYFGDLACGVNDSGCDSTCHNDGNDTGGGCDSGGGDSGGGDGGD